MNPNIICTFCGRQNHSLNYNCDCEKTDWSHTYRTLHHKAKTEEIEDLAPDSFQEYSFFNPLGMLQHQTLPFDKTVTYDYPTVGLTPLHELNNLSQLFGAQVYLKDEGHNPTGCFKDRETVLCLQNSKRRKLKKATIFTSGNAGASAAYFAKRSGIDLIAFVPGDTYPEKIDYIQNRGADVVVIGDDNTNFEKGYELFADLNAEHVFARQGYDNWSVCNPFRIEGDKTIALEIIKQFSMGKKGTQVPEYVIVPTANGSCLTGIWKGFRELEKAGVILKLPRMISVGIKNANPVAKAVRRQTTDCPVSCDQSKPDSEDMKIGSVITAKQGYDSMAASEAVLESGGHAIELQKSDIKQTLVDFLELEESLAIEYNILPEPAALTSIAAIKQLDKKMKLSLSDSVVSVATGHGLKAKNMIYSLISDRPVLLQKTKHILDKKEKAEKNSVTANGKRINVEPNPEAVLQAFVQLQPRYVNV